MDINRYCQFRLARSERRAGRQDGLRQRFKADQGTEALDNAPLVDPYAGPALLTGRAAAVFFHEVFGHRAEGFRQKDINEGQTFTSKIGEQIFPDFMSINDDPTEEKLGGQMLLGYYPFDDEGYPLQNVSLLSITAC